MNRTVRRPSVPLGVYTRPAVGADATSVAGWVRAMREHARRLAEAGQLWDAVEAYNHAIVAEPLNASMLLSKAVLLQRAGHHEHAIAVFDRALALAPQDVAVHYHVAITRLALGSPELALAHLRYAAHAEPRLRFEMAEDPQLAALRGHPAFRKLVGARGYR